MDGMVRLRGWAVGLSTVMVVWIVTLQFGLEAGLLHKIYERDPEKFMTINLITKFKDHLAVRLTHHIGALVWSITAAMQLNANLRAKFPALHRASGYLFFISVLMLSAGIFIIDQRKLHAGDVWPTDEEASEAAPFQDVKLCIHGVHAWFVMSAALAWYHIAIRRDIQTHQRFVYRHLASGLWVAVQRILFSGAAVAILPFKEHLRGTLLPHGTGAAERMLFNGCGALAIAFTVVSTELILRGSLKRGKKMA